MSVKHNLERWISELDSDGMCDISDNQVVAMIRDYAALEAKCAALAAENAELKHAMAITLEHISVTDSGQAGVAAMIINDAMHHSETPATDAFLAEVRASSIPDEATERDLFEEWVMEKIFISKTTLEGLRTDDGYRNSTLSGTDYNGMWSQWKAIRAAQLRKGAAL